MTHLHGRRPEENDADHTDEHDIARAQQLKLTRKAIVRLRCVIYAQNHGVTEAAKHYGFHRSAVDEWLKRYIPGHPESLEERSRRPHKVRSRETNLEIIHTICELRLQDPSITRAEIVQKISEIFSKKVSESTVGRILHEKKLTQRDIGNVANATPVSDDTASTAGREANAPMPHVDADSENAAGDAGAGIVGLAAALIIGVAISLGVATPTAEAAESTSYTLYDQFPNDATTITKESSNYQLTEDSLTWHKKPLVSTNYILNGALSGQQSSSASTASSAGGSTASDGGEGGGNGGRCGDMPCNQGSSRSSEHAAAPGSFSSRIRSARSQASVGQGPISPVPEDDQDKVTLIAGKAPDDFFSAVDALCAPCVRQECPATLRAAAPEEQRAWPIMIAVIAGVISLVVASTLKFLEDLVPEHLRKVLPFAFFLRKNDKDAKRRKQKHARIRRIARTTFTILEIGIISIAVTLGVFWAESALAANIGPQTHVYNGRLLDSSGNAVTSSTNVRFSYWKSEDFQSGDVDGAGAINTGAANYAAWFEVHTVTPDSNGYFSLEMGSVTALPSLASYSVSDLADLFLQVEVKAAAAANTAYELLDVNASSSTIDRSPILSVPFALNADRIDQRDVGTGSGSIPVLASGGLLPIAANPGSTNRDTVIIDNNNTAATEISLQFGQTLAKKLTYDIVNARFNFNASVNVQGNLTVSGLINGIDISSLGTETGTYLRASSGGGLNLRVSQGSYRINGNLTDFAGSGSVGLFPSATNRVFFTGTGLIVTTGTFPTDKSYIPVAEVTTSAGSITSIDDRRVLSSDNREQTIERMFTPAFEHTSFQGDASNNIGQLAISHDNINNHNFYLWTSTKASLQDYDLFVRVPLSSDFEHWDGTVPLQFSYRSTSASALDNALAVQVYDTNGAPVTLGGSTSGLANTSWTTSNITFTGGTWTAGQEFLIKFTFQAKDNYQMQLGKMRLKYVDILDE